MNIWELLILLVVAGVCGSLAQSLVGYTRGGCLISIILGFVGALLGSWLSSTLNLPELLTIQAGDRQFPILWSIIGAALFVALLAMLTGRRRV